MSYSIIFRYLNAIIIREPRPMHKHKLFRTIIGIIFAITVSGCANLSPQNASNSNTQQEEAASTATAPQNTTNTYDDKLPRVSNSVAPAATLEPVQIPSDLVNGHFTSLWDVIRAGFTMNHYYNNSKVQYWVQFYTKDPSFIENITTQATPYLYMIVQQLQAHNMPTEIALLPIVESGFQPHARSWCGALGLWQLMPSTARDLNTGAENHWYNARESVKDSTIAALNYLQYLYNYFNGDWMLALAAYNSGPGTVQNAMNYNSSHNLPTDFWSLRLPSETQNYVPQLLALAIIINDPSHYGIALPLVPNKPLLGTASIPKQMSLSQAAKFAGINESELRALNPAFTKNVTPPKWAGHYTLNLPINKVSTFEQNCAANPEVTGLERYTLATASAKGYSAYRVHRGDTLVTVSHFTGASVATLKSYNHLKSTKLRPSQILRYPVNPTAAYKYVTYTVKSGDTLAKIARKYHVSLFDLMQWNDLSQHSQLRKGERLVIRQKISY